MEQSSYYFADHSGAAVPAKLDLMPAVTIPREAIEAEIERLASIPAPANGRRVSKIANPRSGVGEGLAPGIEVSLSVLKPGERTAISRHVIASAAAEPTVVQPTPTASATGPCSSAPTG